MASSGYATEATVESIWDDTFDTTRFNNINSHIGTKFNFWITRASATDITNTDVAAILAAETSDLIIYYYSIAKERKVSNPWDFIQMAITKLSMGDNFYYYFEKTIKLCQDILNESKRIAYTSTLDLPSHGD